MVHFDKVYVGQAIFMNSLSAVTLEKPFYRTE